MISIHTMELTLQVNSKRFNDLSYRATKKTTGDHRFGPSKYKRHIRVDSALADEGIMVEYHDNDFKKKIVLRVNPSQVLGGDDLDLWKPTKKNCNKLIELLEEHIDDYFDGDYELDDLKLSRVELTANLDVGRKKVPEYIKLMHRIGRVKGFKPKYTKTDYTLRGIKKENSFDLVSTSKDVEFTAYDKEAQLLEKGKERRAKKAKGILRLEVRVKKAKIIQEYFDLVTDSAELSTSKQIILAARESERMFMSVVPVIIPRGSSFRLKQAQNIVEASDYNKSKKKKMLALLKLVPEKKSLYNALRELNTRKSSEVLKWFAKIGLSPITISQRGKLDALESIYTYLGD